MCLLRRQRLSLGTFKRSLCCGMAALLSTSALAAEGASRNIRIDPFDRLILFSSDTTPEVASHNLGFGDSLWRRLRPSSLPPVILLYTSRVISGGMEASTVFVPKIG